MPPPSRTPERSHAHVRRAHVRWLVLAASLCVSGGVISWLIALRREAAGPSLAAMSAELRAIYLAELDPAPRPAWNGSGEPPPLVRAPLDEHLTRLLYPGMVESTFAYDPTLSLRRVGGIEALRRRHNGTKDAFTMRTNSLGMREDADPAARKPDLRVLMTGASNVECACANDESAANVLEARLAKRLDGRVVEVLNAGCAGFNFYNYLATLERYLELDPDVFVIVAYGGNDFFGNARLHRYFNHRGPAEDGPLVIGDELIAHADPFLRSVLGTEVGQAVYYRNNPSDFAFTHEAACSATVAIEELCRANDIALVCAYLPPPMRAQPQHFVELTGELERLLAAPREIFDVSDRFADAWLSFLDRRGIAHVDLRARFASEPTRLYMLEDSHLDPHGQRVIAQELFWPVARAAGLAIEPEKRSKHRVDEGRNQRNGLQEHEHDRGGEQDAKHRD